MEKLIVLGTGNAMVTHYYNTCFALNDGKGTILVDAGGGNGILVALQATEVDFASIRDVIVTHEHSDHVLGIVWIVRKIGTLMLADKYKGDLRFFCHKDLAEAIKAICGYTLQKKFTRLFGERMHFVQIKNDTVCRLLDYDVTFFDIKSTKARQYGFTMQLHNGRKLTCLGDEPYNPLCESFVVGSDWLLAEAFCLYSDRDRFKPYEKHHSTVREACELAEQLNIPNLVLWHTEDKTFGQRRQLYTEEGRQFYKGSLYVPDDRELISL
jgi:ribonuclease Z